MDYEKVTIIIPDIKRVVLSGKVKYKDGVAQITTKTGKALAIPEEQVLFQDSKSVTFRYPRRKILKGSFQSENGFLVDSDNGYRANTEIITFGETQPPKSKSQKAAKDKGKALKVSKGGSVKKAAKSFKIKRNK